MSVILSMWVSDDAAGSKEILERKMRSGEYHWPLGNTRHGIRSCVRHWHRGE